MLRKIFKTGNSTVVSLPREMLESLGVRDGSDVSVDEVFARQVAEFIDEYRSALDALAR